MFWVVTESGIRSIGWYYFEDERLVAHLAERHPNEIYFQADFVIDRPRMTWKNV